MERVKEKRTQRLHPEQHELRSETEKGRRHKVRKQRKHEEMKGLFS